MRTIKTVIAVLLAISAANCAIFQTHQFYSPPVQSTSTDQNLYNYFWNPATPNYIPPQNTNSGDNSGSFMNNPNYQQPAPPVSPQD